MALIVNGYAFDENDCRTAAWALSVKSLDEYAKTLGYTKECALKEECLYKANYYDKLARDFKVEADKLAKSI